MTYQSFTFSFTLNHLSFTIYLYVPSARQALGRGHRYLFLGIHHLYSPPGVLLKTFPMLARLHGTQGSVTPQRKPL
jgi:hypothetical protein